VAKERVDILLVERGLAPSRARARAYILAGKVYSAEQRIEKAGHQLAADRPLEVRGPDHAYVSRGGLKLEGALDTFRFDPLAMVAADFGASTGGFTDCLLQRGAKKVYAIDVGYGQLHNRLRQDERVVSLERTNARHLVDGDLPEAVDLVVIDASFIGLGKLLPAAHRLLKKEGVVIALVKPQFEAGKARLGKGGVVRDEDVRRSIIAEVVEQAKRCGFAVGGLADAKIKGPKGNHEALLMLKRVDLGAEVSAESI